MPPRKRAALTTLSEATPVMDGLAETLPSQATWNAMMQNVEGKARKPRFQWLYFQQTLTSHTILHARNGGEQTVLSAADHHFVDGYIPALRMVYEFHGCLYHGCERCFPTRRGSHHFRNEDRTLNELFRATQQKTHLLRVAGYNVVEMWECECDDMTKTNIDVKTFLESFQLVPPFESREAFFGGRMGAVSLLEQAAPDEKIFYVDVTSLYPSYINTRNAKG